MSRRDVLPKITENYILKITETQKQTIEKNLRPSHTLVDFVGRSFYNYDRGCEKIHRQSLNIAHLEGASARQIHFWFFLLSYIE